ncbi:uncharacterized protein LOC133310177 [Gastrolobium bilobum]|uniref:uncharacterized protein LOC133310177 n=1 Tax=Gastrolobium bilobum TaxID=150636 RepID=UPI002AB1FC61|nr:uncharacterized protein LOC133310177 [Gastrolobium bilobum]
MTPNTRTVVNAASGGSLKTKTSEEALELLESLASQEYDNAPAPQRRAGIMKLDGYDAILAQNDQILQSNKKQQQQLDALTKQFSDFQVSSNTSVAFVNTSSIVCDICAGAHTTDDCKAPETADVNGIWHDQKVPYNPGRNQYGNNQNQGWRNKNQNQHPRFSYSSNHQLNPPMPVQQQPPQQSEWEKAFAQLSKTTSDYIQSSNNFREDTQPLCKRQGPHSGIKKLLSGILKLRLASYQSSSLKEFKELFQEKEKEVAKEFAAEKTVPEKKEFKWEKKKAQERQENPLELSPYAKIPYPQRFREEIKKQQYSKFLDIFKKLQINIPFTEALENMPNYAKFMKDLLSRKRKLQECETVTLTAECSAIIQKKLPPKLKDPGRFSIPCNIRNMEVKNVLCDLGASINVMPLFMMKKLGITEVRPTKTIVQLADRSTKQAYGIIEDILIKVDKFIIPVDFVILDIEENSTIPMIFGRPFLATSGAMIDVPKDELILRVDGEQAIFKFFDKEVPSPIIQPQDQVYYISVSGIKAYTDTTQDADRNDSAPTTEIDED